MWQGEHFVSRGLNGTRLVNANVATLGCQYPLVACKQSIDDGGVGLSATHKEMNACLGCAASLLNELLGVGCEIVSSITHCFEEICFDESLEHLGMGSCHIVGFEV